MNERLLVFDCHEAWVYQLQALPQSMDVVVGLRGRPIDGWDESIRPVPRNARLVRFDDVLRKPPAYHCIVAHNLTDLLDAKSLPGPRLLVVHETLDGAMREQGATVPVHEFRSAVSKFVRMTGTHVVAVSKLKGRSWGFEDDVVPFSADPADYPAWKGDLARGLRVCELHRTSGHAFCYGNFISNPSRACRLHWLGKTPAFTTSNPPPAGTT